MDPTMTPATEPVPDWTGFFAGHLDPVPLVVILRGLSERDAVAAAHEAWDAGVRLVEVTLESEGGPGVLDAVVRAAPEGLPVGAGTVTTPERLDTAAEAGARFAVAPGLDPDTVAAAGHRGMPFLPGIATPTEAGQALRLGVATVKAFPASTLGPDWVRALAGPFPELRVLVTGGVTIDTAPAFLRAGAAGIGVGGAFTGGGLAGLVRTVRTPA
ncbi:2-keto-3-deoxy-phosphogluconate aldolase [Haloechinothrix alba]|uniref:2-keto-3-deoxy-phosphogluconate aldolase n=1 Tax=Haloechinothrix alba TaxID=664784 RepID=A0A238WRQ7_9PSEU|nr:bifunctional 4-hydroxy-2-oxoglutarate aldolase/2-dehydro-3-deoxy-phosphogluconate aldolase [Haloechinothrix alba]SNR49215.1 2-keto-3-deoxy-phosphogluconate aldolase [Haloechinothrix alba]